MSEQFNGNNSGAVNFDAGVVTENAAQEMYAVNVAPVEPHISIGGVRELGEVPVQVAPAPVVKPKVMAHTIGLTLCLTLNTGFTLIKGLKDLKNVEIDHGGNVQEFNFYNPFMRQDTDKNTGEGLLRKCLGSIAKNAHNLLGREVVFLGTDAEANERIADLTEAVRSNVETQFFPLVPFDQVCSVPILVDGVEVPRMINFSDLFAATAWCSKQIDVDAAVTTHMVTVNIMLNVGALYDSKEPHVFVNKAHSYLEGLLTKLGINESIAYHVNVCFDSNMLADQRTRDMIELLVTERGYYVMSKASVLEGRQDWISQPDADKLFGYGCDVALISPEPTDEVDAE